MTNPQIDLATFQTIIKLLTPAPVAPIAPIAPVFNKGSEDIAGNNITLLSPVVFRVFPIISKQLKVFNSIIFSISIYVMYYFFFLEKSAKFLFHYKAMFVDIKIPFYKRVVRLVNTNVAVLFNSAPLIMVSFCVGAFRGAKHSLQMTIRGKTLSAMKTRLCYIRKLTSTFTRTEISFPNSIARIISELLFTIKTSIGFHQYLFYTIDIKEAI